MSLTLLLRCDDLQETREFYRSVLGFSVMDSAENTLTVEKAGATLLFTEHDLWKSRPACSGTFYFSIADVDGFYAEVRNRTAIAWPLQEMPYGGREFGIDDCNGYCLAFRQQA